LIESTQRYAYHIVTRNIFYITVRLNRLSSGSLALLYFINHHSTIYFSKLKINNRIGIFSIAKVQHYFETAKLL